MWKLKITGLVARIVWHRRTPLWVKRKFLDYVVRKTAAKFRFKA